MLLTTTTTMRALAERLPRKREGRTESRNPVRRR